MQVLILAMFIDDDRKGPMATRLRHNPLDDLIERMHREMERGRDSDRERAADGSKVA